jgi:hypothetical protein
MFHFGQSVSPGKRDLHTSSTGDIITKKNNQKNCLWRRPRRHTTNIYTFGGTPPQAWFIAMLGYFYTLVFVVHAEVKQLCVLPLMPNQKI